MRRSINVGIADQVARLVVGLVALLLAGFVLHGVPAVVAWVLGFLALGTAATRVCPAYFVFGVNTNAPKPQGH